MPLNRETRVRPSSWDHGRSICRRLVSTRAVRQCAVVHLGQGGPDKPAARASQEAGGDEVGGAGDGGEEGAVDSLPPGTCLAKEKLMSWSLNKNKYFPKHTFFM